jgi:hypothetical protein
MGPAQNGGEKVISPMIVSSERRRPGLLPVPSPAQPCS